jgi:uncharacterized protein
MIHETVVGRERKDLEKYGNIATGYIGKHIVGTGEDTHLTTKVLIDLLKPHVILCCGKRGSGKCVTGDTLVYLNDGRIMPIKEIVERKEKVGLVSLNQQNFLIEESKAIEFFERSVDKIIKIKLQNGVEVKVTENHPVLTPFGWKEAKEIKIGDFIAIPSEIKISGNGFLTDSEIKIISLILGECTIGKNFVNFTIFDKKLAEEFCEFVKDFDKSLKLIKKKNKKFSKGMKITVIGNKISNWLTSLGIKNKNSEVNIPPVIFSLQDKKVALFLKYFFTYNGFVHIKKTRKGNKKIFAIEYLSKSKKMVESIYHLLLRFGIISFLREKKVKNKIYYKLLIIDRESLKNFVNRIGFIGKIKFIDKILNNKNDFYNGTNLLPKEIWNYIIRKYKEEDISIALGYKNLKGDWKNKYPTKMTIRKIGEFLNDNFLKKISSPGIAWMKVKKIEILFYPTKVYDLTVNDHHNFVGNGVILHNSYSAAVILEEFCQLEENFRKKLAFVVVDPMGIYWSMKFPNVQQENLLKQWNLEPKGFKDLVQVFVPEKQKESYEKAGIPIDGTISISLREFSAEDLILAYGLKRTEEIAIALEKNFNKLLSLGKTFGFEELISEVKNDLETRIEIRNALVSLLEVSMQWGLIVKEGIKLEDLVQPGKVTIIDLSRLASTELRSLLVALLARKIYHTRVLARKEEERVKIEGGEPKITFPITWFVLEESHNFIPSDREVASSDAIKRLAKEGREPGIGLLVITQMPNKVHQDILSQCDLVISFRLTSKDDLQALHAVMQTYMAEEIEKFINRLPRWPGAAIILDDNLEKVFTVNIRPRLSWHAGGTATLI